jgi:hypothetical protein
VICRDARDLDMGEIYKVMELLGRQSREVLARKIRGFEEDPMHEQKTKRRYERAVNDIAFGFYLGALLRAVETRDVNATFAIMLVCEAVGFSPEAH